MKQTRSTLMVTGVLSLAACMISAGAYSETEAGFTYSDEWSIVSAPPPSGPYRAVHVDPRVPGQGITPPVTSSFSENLEQLPADMQPDIQAAGASATAGSTVDADTAAAGGTEQPASVDETKAGLSVPALADTVKPADEGTSLLPGGTEQPIPVEPVAVEDMAAPVAAPEVAGMGPGETVQPAPDMSAPAAGQASQPGMEPPVAAGSQPEQPLPPAIPGHYRPGIPVRKDELAATQPVAPAPMPAPAVPGEIVQGGGMPVAVKPAAPPVQLQAQQPRTATMPPSAGHPQGSAFPGARQPGQYPRMAPPAYGYPGTGGWQRGWPGMSGYPAMPRYGYPAYPAERPAVEVPPPGGYAPPPYYGGGYPGR